MSNTVKPTDLGKAIGEELTTYHKDVLERVNAAGSEAVKALVKKTKATAPKETGDFRKAIASKEEKNGSAGDKKFIWGVKAPHHRLTHLLVHGHAKAGGGRVDGNPFLQDALDQVLPEYERKVEEALQ